MIPSKPVASKGKPHRPVRLYTASFIKILCAWAAVPLGVCSSVSEAVAQSGVAINPIALYGQSAPGTVGEFFAYFGQPRINVQGDIAFEALLFSTGNDQFGLWRQLGDGALELVTRSGGQVPTYDVGTATLEIPGPFAIDSQGNVAFLGILKGGGSVDPGNNVGIWVTGGSASELWLAARTNDFANTSIDGVLPPVEARARYVILGGPAISPGGAISFTGWVLGSDEIYLPGAWVFPRPAAPPTADTRALLIALSGDLAPAGGTPGDPFAEIGLPQTGMGLQFSFKASLDSSNPTPFGSQGIWLGPANALNPLALTGDLAPEIPSAAPYYQLGNSVINSSSQVAFWGGVESQDNPEGLWLRKFGSTGLLALAGYPAAGLPATVLFDYFFDPVINESGNVAFLAYLKGEGVDASNHQGIWSGGGRDYLRLLARTGDAAPGAGANARFSGFSSPRINEIGQVVFTASLSSDDDEVGNGNDFGVWAQDINGDLLPVLIEGDQLEVAVGDFRTVKKVAVSDFSDAGEMALQIEFTDGTPGVFKAILPVPDLRSYDEWSALIANQNLAGRTEDADGDGIPNILEFAFGLNPNTPDSEKMPAPSLVELGGSGEAAKALTLKFQRRLDQNEINYVVEVSTDLVNWRSGVEFSGEINRSLVGGGLEEVVVRDLIDSGQFDRCFIRLRVE